MILRNDALDSKIVVERGTSGKERHPLPFERRATHRGPLSLGEDDGENNGFYTQTNNQNQSVPGGPLGSVAAWPA